MKKLKLKSILSITLTTLLSFSLVACGKSTEKNSSALDKIKQNKKIVLGTCADYPPYEFHKEVNGKDTIVGLDIEIAKSVAKDLGVELEIKDMKFDGLLPALSSGNIDFIVASMTPTAERAKSVDFSKIYYKASQAIIVKAENSDKFTSLESLEGLRIGAQKGTLQEEIAKTQIPNSKVKSLPKVTDLILALNTDKVDAVVMEEPVAKAYAAHDKSIGLTNIKVVDEEGGSAIAVKKGSADFVKALNETIDKLQKENKIDEFVIKANELQD
ncbi:transporter substrate-binding domain-containing protein [Haloimpatiens lingqiaonensis]|uniref:transporter substrate-binding domain-containing protein n=1 Tax=Haloimpatiens lingqiaonensis TaxID=1380675 RepID=UPI0010FDDF3C|nr:transporter substrate-binding domain-containing protein [Haloimpatiens lingqiaonensis]